MACPRRSATSSTPSSRRSTTTASPCSGRRRWTQGPLDDALLASVLALPIEAIGEGIRDARNAGVLAVGHGPGTDGRPRFRHELQREVLVEQLGRGERRNLHARFADALEASDPDPSRASAIALHRNGAGDDRRALDAHVAAMDAAERAFAFDAAAVHGARAAALRQDVGRGGCAAARCRQPARARIARRAARG